MAGWGAVDANEARPTGGPVSGVPFLPPELVAARFPSLALSAAFLFSSSAAPPTTSPSLVFLPPIPPPAKSPQNTMPADSYPVGKDGKEVSPVRAPSGSRSAPRSARRACPSSSDALTVRRSRTLSLGLPRVLRSRQIVTVGSDRFGFNSVVPIKTLRSLYLVRLALSVLASAAPALDCRVDRDAFLPQAKTADDQEDPYASSSIYK